MKSQSLIERIRRAKTNVELANLASELATYKFISPATKRKANRELDKKYRA